MDMSSAKKQDNKKKGVFFRSNEESSRLRKSSLNESTIDHLTNKKREYIEEVIVDKNGEYAYDEDP